jgi:hypothetical protein
MATERQIAANHLNARHSTGSGTAEGKSQSSRNTVTHGLTARNTLLTDESFEDFQKMRESVLEELNPESPLELEFVERIVSILGRMRRIPAFEAALVAWIGVCEGSKTLYIFNKPSLPGDPRNTS